MNLLNLPKVQLRLCMICMKLLLMNCFAQIWGNPVEIIIIMLLQNYNCKWHFLWMFPENRLIHGIYCWRLEMKDACFQGYNGQRILILWASTYIFWSWWVSYPLTVFFFFCFWQKEQVKRLHLLLTVKDSADNIPKNLEARRRLEFFTNSLFMDIPPAKPVCEMMPFWYIIWFFDRWFQVCTRLYSDLLLLFFICLW